MATPTTSKTKTEIKPTNLAEYKKAISLGKELTKKGDTTKAEVSRKMYELIHGEERDVIVQAFIEGAGLTPKGAMTYVYNIRRKIKKSS